MQHGMLSRGKPDYGSEIADLTFVWKTWDDFAAARQPCQKIRRLSVPCLFDDDDERCNPEHVLLSEGRMTSFCTGSYHRARSTICALRLSTTGAWQQ